MGINVYMNGCVLSENRWCYKVGAQSGDSRRIVRRQWIYSVRQVSAKSAPSQRIVSTQWGILGYSVSKIIRYLLVNHINSNHQQVLFSSLISGFRHSFLDTRQCAPSQRIVDRQSADSWRIVSAQWIDSRQIVGAQSAHSGQIVGRQLAHSQRIVDRQWL